MKLRSILAVLAVTTSAQANIVERIVAVVDDRPILMSELHHRSEPELRASNASESEVHRRVLDQMIAEQLVAKEAQRAHVFVTVDEIDRAIAAQTKQVGNLQAQLAGLGMTEQEYRDELRRQILEGKLVQLRVAGRVRVTEADARDSYAKWSIDFRKSEPLDANVLQAYGLQIMPPITGPADICDTARRILTTRFDCGRRTLMLAAIPSPVHERLAALEPGDVTPPIPAFRHLCRSDRDGLSNLDRGARRAVHAVRECRVLERAFDDARHLRADAPIEEHPANADGRILDRFDDRFEHEIAHSPRTTIALNRSASCSRFFFSIAPSIANVERPCESDQLASAAS